MAIFVGADWVQERVDDPNILIVDPRRPMKYLQGHLKNAVNLPTFKAFTAEARLRSEGDLARWLGDAGLGEGITAVLYDSPEGQNGAMLAWILDYLGCSNVHLLDIFFEGWVSQGREVYYKPVRATARPFTVAPNRNVRATPDEIRDNRAVKLIDFRSQDEYTGARDFDGKPGHIPGAVNVVWRDLNGASRSVLAPNEQIERRLKAAGVSRSDTIVAYCRTGPRAALGYLALKHCGYDVRLYDGSYAEWVRNGLPVEL